MKASIFLSIVSLWGLSSAASIDQIVLNNFKKMLVPFATLSCMAVKEPQIEGEIKACRATIPVESLKKKMDDKAEDLIKRKNEFCTETGKPKFVAVLTAGEEEKKAFDAEPDKKKYVHLLPMKTCMKKLFEKYNIDYN